jgi:arabinan endo-1,5-alpha-L-arabinosidase
MIFLQYRQKISIKMIYNLICVILSITPVSLHSAPAYAHDPSLIREGEYLYLFATGQGIPVQRTRDLKVWEYLPAVFSAIPAWMGREVPGFAGSMWAPDISLHAGTYYLYYSVSTFGSNRSCIGLATNTTLDPHSPAYNWVDAGKVIESIPDRDNWNAIDPAMSVDAEGQWYLAFGSFWDGIKMIAIDPRNAKALRDPPDIISLARRPGVRDDPIEAPFVYQRNGFYYLFVSFDFCCRGTRSDYKIAVGRSRLITGPYADEKGTSMNEGGGSIILESYDDVHGPGHCSVLREGDRDLLVHHMYDGKRGGAPVLQVRPITWSSDGWPEVGLPLAAP